MGLLTLSLDSEVAVRLADEGVPLRAIARATRISSDLLRSALSRAQADGRLPRLPRDDWPPGYPREHLASPPAAVTTVRAAAQDSDSFMFMLALQRAFKLTRTEVTLLQIMLHQPTLLRERAPNPASVDVHISYLRRKLAPFGVEIKTLWGFGYQLQAQSRSRVMDLVLRYITS